MPPRKSKTPEQIHQEEMDKMTCPPTSYLINIVKKNRDGKEVGMSSWRYVDLANALKAYGSLLSLLSEEAILVKGGEAYSGTLELSRCDRDRKPVEFLIMTVVKGYDKTAIDNRGGVTQFR